MRGLIVEMCKKVIVGGILLIINLMIASYLYGENEKELETRFKNFLSDVRYLISSEEKEYFLSLPDEQKDIFIKQFWEKLDPIPITPENEFKEEYYKRLEFVDKWYGRNTDRGRIYLLLGKPDSIESYNSAPGLYPLELWHYDNLNIEGLPHSLRLIFYKPYGVGEYRLYSPLIDGIRSLLINKSLDERALSTKFTLWESLSFDLRAAIESSSVGLNKNTSEMYLSRLNLPLNTIKKTFGAKERATVETQIVYGSFPAEFISFTNLIDNNYITHISIEIPNSFITYEKVKENYYARVDVSIQITDKKNQQIDQINDQINLSFSEIQWEDVKGLPLFYSFAYLLLPGEYHLLALIRNFAKNEVGKIEKDIVVNEIANAEIDASGLILGYKANFIENKFNKLSAFVFRNFKFYPLSKNLYSSLQKMHLYMELYINKEELPFDQLEINYVIKNKEIEEVKLYEIKNIKNELIENRVIPIYKVISLDKLKKGSYLIEVIISGGNQELLRRKSEFFITDTLQNFKKIMAESTIEINAFYMHYNLAKQYFLKGDFEKAKYHSLIAMDIDKASLEAKLLHSEILISNKENNEAIKILEPLTMVYKNNKYLLLNLGRANFQENNFSIALKYFIEAEKAGESENYQLMNYIGESYLKLGNKQEALRYFKKSLELQGK